MIIPVTASRDYCGRCVNDGVSNLARTRGVVAQGFLFYATYFGIVGGPGVGLGGRRGNGEVWGLGRYSGVIGGWLY